MQIETEVKYLIDQLPNDLPQPNYIEQRYFSMSGKEEVLKRIFDLESLSEIKTSRIRMIKTDQTKYVLTLKTSGLYSRKEYEQVIDYELYQELLHQPIKTCIIKNRYVINHSGFTFEFDEYLNLKQPLYTVEVELENLDHIKEIELILKNTFKLKYLDVTLNPKYKNSNLKKFFG